MQIVIDIPYVAYMEWSNDEWNLPMDLVDALQNAIRLPEGHGDLIDRKTLIPDSDYEDGIFGAVSCQQIVEAEAIIEADMAESEEI